MNNKKNLQSFDDIDNVHQIDEFVAYLARMIARKHAISQGKTKQSANPKNKPRNGKI